MVDRGLISCYFLVVFKLHTSLYDYFFRLLCYVILNSVYYYRSTYLYSLLSPADHPTSLKSMISFPISIQYCFIGQEFHRMAYTHKTTSTSQPSPNRTYHLNKNTLSISPNKTSFKWRSFQWTRLYKNGWVHFDPSRPDVPIDTICKNSKDG